MALDSLFFVSKRLTAVAAAIACLMAARLVAHMADHGSPAEVRVAIRG